MPPAVAVWYLRGVSDCPLLAWGLPLRSGRGGAVGVAAQLVVFLACGVYGGGEERFRGGGLSADAPLSTRAKREMLIRRPRCAARSKTLWLW